MSERGRRPNGSRLRNIYPLIVILEVPLHYLIYCKVRGISGETSTDYGLRAFPEAEPATLFAV